jgi:hypothetical protein
MPLFFGELPGLGTGDVYIRMIALMDMAGTEKGRDEYDGIR